MNANDINPVLEFPQVHVVNLVDGRKALKHLERICRTCYKSEDKITEDSYEGFLRGIIDRGHEAMLEHVSVTVLFYTDRGVSHELIRHRLASYAQSSTRYCNYSHDKFGNAIHVIRPTYFNSGDAREAAHVPHFVDVGTNWDVQMERCKLNAFDVCFVAMLYATWAYQTLVRKFNCSPQEARSVLPQSTATDIAVTANLREWRHMFKLRVLGTTGMPHPDMREVMLCALAAMHREFPIVFEDIVDECVTKGILS